MANTEQSQCILQALQLNRETHKKLKELESSLYQRLVDIRRLKNYDSKIVQKLKVPNYYPYFKDKLGSMPLDNEDTIYMREAEMYDFYSGSSSYFTVKDKRDFLKTLLAMAREAKSKELFNSIRKIKKENNIMNTKNLQYLLKQSILVDKMELKDLYELVSEFNWNTVAQKLKYRHKPQEYQAMWNLFLHPSINKQEWTDTELLKLKEIAQNNNNQNWFKIAKALNTDRSPYQCFVMYRTNIDIKSGIKWTEDEDNNLKNLVETCKNDSAIPWGRVAKSLANKTTEQVYNRWNNSLRPGLKKGRFTKEEDEVLLACVNKYGTDFNIISEYINGRNAKQLRQRYKCLDKFVSVEWTVEEDQKLMYLMADPSNQNKYSEIVHNFPGKKNYNLRMRYKTLVKWMNNNPEEDLASAPRRPPRRLYHGVTTKSVEKALQKLKQSNNSSKRVEKPKVREKLINSIVTKLINYKMKLKQLAKQKQRIKNKNTVSRYQNLITKNSKDIKTDNLRNLLILLRASLDKEIFTKSIYGKKYPDLLCPPKTIKTYSKTQNTLHDIWTNVLQGKSTLCLPPNLSTIIGCRNLMMMSREQQMESNKSITTMCDRDPIFKVSWTNFVNRFSTLFFWPLMLSNIPTESIKMGKGSKKYKTK